MHNFAREGNCNNDDADWKRRKQLHAKHYGGTLQLTAAKAGVRFQ